MGSTGRVWNHGPTPSVASTLTQDSRSSRSYLLRVEHDKLTEHFFSHGPQKKEKKRDNKSSEKKKKGGTQKETLLHEH